MPEYIRKLLTETTNNVSDSNGDNVENSNSHYISFNSNIGLKARLYNKNKTLMEKALGKTPEREKESRRDSFFDIFESHVKRLEQDKKDL